MILNNQEAEDVFQLISSNLDPRFQIKEEEVLQLRPVDFSLMDWRFELRGLARGLALSGAIPLKVAKTVDERLFKPFSKKEKRPGRDYKYSVDVYSKGVDGKKIIFEFDVAAMNPTDAYVQLTKRLVFMSIPDVYTVKVYNNFIENRVENQFPAKTFDKESLIFVKPS